MWMQVYARSLKLGSKMDIDNITASLKHNLEASIEAKQAMLNNADMIQVFSAACAALIQCYKNGGRLYVAGNGGSAADAQHLVAEFVSKLARDRAPLPAEALTTDSSILTAIGNDYGFEHVFSRQLEGKLQSGDMFLGVTTSGNSPNILRALEVCKRKSVTSIVLTGHAGGAAKDLCDYCVIAPGQTTATIQELHIVLEHSLCECVEKAVFGF